MHTLSGNEPTEPVADDVLQPTTEQLAHRRMLTERVRRDCEEMYEETRQDE